MVTASTASLNRRVLVNLCNRNIQTEPVISAERKTFISLKWVALTKLTNES
jgi:hypothetical protein